MKTIRDPKFIKTITHRFAGCVLPRSAIADMRIEISGNSGVGLRLNICNQRQSVIELGWHCGGAWAIAGIARFDQLQSCDEDALSRCVGAFLRKHDLIERNGRSAIEYDREIDTLLNMMAQMTAAVAAGEWTKAREMWEFMAPLHARWIERDPSLAHVSTVLRQNEVFASQQTSGIH
jgi:hypothetical protein